jgi:hypothetical protein
MAALRTTSTDPVLCTMAPVPQIKIMDIKLKESVFHMGVDEVS